MEMCNDISTVYTAAEAEKKWGLSAGLVRQHCVRGRLKPYIERGLVRKSEGTWLVTDQAMREVFGDPKEENGTGE